MWDVIEYLKDPQLVARIQEYYGVKIIQQQKNGNAYTDKKSTFTNKGNRVLQRDNIEHKRTSETTFTHSMNHHTLSKSKTSQSAKTNGFSSQNLDDETKDDETVSSESESESKEYIITNWLWYYLFVLGTALGDEIFYASFIPFWFWNIDGAVGRRVVLVWTIIMYIGQGIKDIVRWPRPACPPVVRLQNKWALEYGMPSTHAMVGVSIPLSVILYTMNRYQYSVTLGVMFAIAWCSVICISRLYLGMHTVLDIVAGILLVLLLMVPVVPLVDALDHHLLTNRWSPVVILPLSILLIVFYPSSDRWTPTRYRSGEIHFNYLR